MKPLLQAIKDRLLRALSWIFDYSPYIIIALLLLIAVLDGVRIHNQNRHYKLNKQRHHLEQRYVEQIIEQNTLLLKYLNEDK